MENLKIRVNSADESKEAQELFFKLGGKWGAGGRKIKNTNEPYLYLESGLVLHGFLSETFNTEQHKEVTLLELRAMANQEQDEPFLTPECTLNDQYAEIEQVRQVEIQGTAKAKPDFNFGGAQAVGGVDATLAERQSTYGNFEDVAFVTENIIHILAKVRVNGLDDLPNTHRMALYMIASKMARIVNGDFNHLDSWHDIGGYSKLIEKLIKGE